MKLKLANLKEPLNIGDMGFSGVMSLGTGMSRGATNAPTVKEELELVGDLIKVTKNGKVIFVPVSNCRFIVAE